MRVCMCMCVCVPFRVDPVSATSFKVRVVCEATQRAVGVTKKPRVNNNKSNSIKKETT